ncbi:tetraacyldisaccharide 4'-kinase [Hymenobacter ginsengisoli]|uniref:Tetraacyldisaccharide 4'-kinase n=1 Tax=Hymenobacter ginsengisoli TaxID=1051626 RepID=A0ABP8Q9A3_9BACT|nr:MULTISPECIES: tetraacyldisaccharide 4'-kinase [unclassified Hymenobacter]MBO2030940.1 tetraacyldisaccharide 4'-kinase [Hymenobacter sp. BT559]
MLPPWPAWLLLPFSWLYAAVLAVRNWLYDHSWKRSAPGWVPLLGVGNLRVGGTGKTPHVAWLVEELLRQGQHPAILSRGYGRQSKGPRLATAADSAATVGDEPWQYYQEFSAQRVPIAVAENRQLGLNLLRQHHPSLTCVVLDDAYQHRRVRPTLNILLTELARPFYTDFVLPAGRLRESRAEAARADVVILTKCPPGLSASAQAAAAAQVQRYARPGVPVLFSAYTYGAPQPLLAALGLELENVPGPPATAGPALLLTGIAQPGPLRDYLKSQGYSIVHHQQLPDHHTFQPEDLEALRRHWQPGWPIFTTEKDATRLASPALWAGSRQALASYVYTIPVRVALLGEGAARLAGLVAQATQPAAR